MTSTQQQPNRRDEISRSAEGLIDEVEVARLIGLSVAFVQKDRVTGRHGIPFIRIGSAVRYRPSNVAAWIDDHAVQRSQELA